ncbi:MAG: hypothetical protein IIZ39_00875, partial [Blautia sp.]|nr:hypothetical protein [Blautia sp.]
MATEEKKSCPAGLVYFEGLEDPRQYVIFHSATVEGQQGMEVFTTSSLKLTYPFLDQKQCTIYREEGKWYYQNLSEEVYTFVGGVHVKP